MLPDGSVVCVPKLNTQPPAWTPTIGVNPDGDVAAGNNRPPGVSMTLTIVWSAGRLRSIPGLGATSTPVAGSGSSVVPVDPLGGPVSSPGAPADPPYAVSPPPPDPEVSVATNTRGAYPAPRRAAPAALDAFPLPEDGRTATSSRPGSTGGSRSEGIRASEILGPRVCIATISQRTGPRARRTSATSCTWS